MLASLRCLDLLAPGLFAAGKDKVAKALTQLGIEIAGVRSPAKNTGLAVGRVDAVSPHPDAEKLKVCRVTLGKNGGERTIVCGAPNVVPGIFVAVAQDGARLANGAQIADRDIRGVRSQGMICSLHELTGDANVAESDKEGILALPVASNEATLAEVESLLFLDDVVFDLEHTTNRADLNGLFPLAVELAGVLGLRAPSLPKPFVGARHRRAFGSRDAAVCKTLGLLAVGNVKIADSPLLTRNVLRASGVKPVSNVVDATNAAMVMSGCAAHAYDANAVSGRLSARLAKEGERVLAINGREYALTPKDIVIADKNGPLGIAGIIGGRPSSIQATTTAVIAETAIFDQRTVRATASRTVASAASGMSGRVLPPYLPYMSLVWFAHYIKLAQPNALMSRPTGLRQNRRVRTLRHLRLDLAKKMLGAEISNGSAKASLAKVGIKTFGFGRLLFMRTPKWRSDVATFADAAEEITRGQGLDDPVYDPQPPTAPARAEVLDEAKAANAVRHLLLARNLFEVRTYSLTSAAQNATYSMGDGASPVRLGNAQSAERAEMRLMLLGKLVDVLAHNRSHKRENVPIFEVQDVTTAAGPRRRVAGLISGRLFDNAVTKNGLAADFYVMKGVVAAVAELFGKRLAFREAKEPPPFAHPSRVAKLMAGDEFAGWLAELHPSLAPEGALAYVFELDVTGLALAERSVVEPSSLPTSRRDVSFTLPAGVDLDALLEGLRVLAHVTSLAVFDHYVDEGSKERSVAVALYLQGRAATLTSEQIDQTMDLARKVVADAGCRVK